MEFIRFGLLLTMTVALVSVAVRHGDDHGSRNQAGSGHRPSASPSSAATAGQSESPSPSTSSGGASGSGGAAGSGGASGSGGSDSAGGGSSNDNGGTTGSGVATLPRTGATQAVELAGIAALFIAAGTFGMRLARPAPARQAGAAAIERRQSGQALGSSESNRPGTV